MNHDRQELILDFVRKKISKEELVELFFQGGCIPENYLYDELKNALVVKDSDSVEFLLVFGSVFGFPQSCAGVLCCLLVQDWHFSHENIARVLKALKYSGAVDYLFEAATADYSYIASEYALGVKCIYALYELGTDDAKEKLRILTKVDNPEMSELAGRLLAS